MNQLMATRPGALRLTAFRRNALFASTRHSSTSAASQQAKGDSTAASSSQEPASSAGESRSSTAQPKAAKKSVLQQDEELRQKMSGLAGDGGESGVEYEDGKPASMKRSVKNNMFRYI